MNLRWVPVLVGAVSTLAVAAFFMVHRSGSFQEKEGPEPDAPDKAMAWRLLAWRDEQGRIPKNGLLNAKEQILAMAERSARPMVDGAVWVERGPTNIPGRSRGLAIHPNDPNKMWMGSVGGGIWSSVDGGSHWKPVDDKLPSLAVSQIIFDPSNPDIMYAGQGEGFYNIDTVVGSGILKSTDGGKKWDLIPSSNDLGAINKLAVSSKDGNVILAACAPDWAKWPAGGIYRSTDGGATWTRTYVASDGTDVKFNPKDPTKAIAVVRNGNGNFETGYSTDAGATWTKSNLEFGGWGSRIVVAYAPSSPGTVYAGSGAEGLVYRSTDGGQTFSVQTTTGGFDTGQAWYDLDIWVDPTNPNVVVVCGVNVYRSVDAGVTVDQIGSGYIMTEQPHPDAHYLVSDPRYDGKSNRTLYVTTDGGAYVAKDIYTASTSSGWAMLSRDARTTQYYGAAGDGSTGNIIGGTQDNGTHGFVNGTNDGFAVFGGDGGFCAMDPTDNNYQYGEYVFLTPFRTRDGGWTAEWMFDGLDDAWGWANFIAPIVLDLNNPNTIYGGGGSLWRCSNAKADSPVWSAVRPPQNDVISAITVAPHTSQVVWVGYNDGSVGKTTNATAAQPAWTVIDDNNGANPLPNRYVGRIAIDPSDVNTVYVSFGSFSYDNLWVTHDGGATWKPINGSGTTALPYAPIRGIAVDPKDPSTIWVGTEVGICVTHDGGATWSAPADGPLNVAVDELVYMHHSNRLLAATHGRGLWIYGVPGFASLVAKSKVSPGTSFKLRVNLDMPAPASGLVVALSSSDPAVTVPTSVAIPAGGWSASVTAKAASVSDATEVTLTAKYRTNQKSVKVTVQPATVGALSASPAIVEGGSTVHPEITVKATMTSDADITATLNSSIAALQVPSTVTIPAGSTSASVTATTSQVPYATEAVVTATHGNTTVKTKVTLLPPSKIGLLLSRRNVTGGSQQTVSAKAILLNPAPAGGAVVTLTSSLPDVASVPASVTVPEGAYTVTVPVTHRAVTTTQTVTLVAQRGDRKTQATLLVYPANVDAVVLNPTTVYGSLKIVNGAIKILKPAPEGGIVAGLVSSNPAVATVSPDSAFIPAGSTKGNFWVTTKVVNAKTLVTITAGGTKPKSAVLTVLPPGLARLSLSRTTVVGGSGTQVLGTVKLNLPAGSVGRKVTLASSNASIATVPASVTVQPGDQTATFSVATVKVSAIQTVTITATLDGVTKQASLSVTP